VYDLLNMGNLYMGLRYLVGGFVWEAPLSSAESDLYCVRCGCAAWLHACVCGGRVECITVTIGMYLAPCPPWFRAISCGVSCYLARCVEFVTDGCAEPIVAFTPQRPPPVTLLYPT
jgi:hypothetical protein